MNEKQEFFVKRCLAMSTDRIDLIIKICKEKGYDSLREFANAVYNYHKNIDDPIDPRKKRLEDLRLKIIRTQGQLLAEGEDKRKREFRRHQQASADIVKEVTTEEDWKTFQILVDKTDNTFQMSDDPKARSLGETSQNMAARLFDRLCIVDKARAEKIMNLDGLSNNQNGQI